MRNVLFAAVAAVALTVPATAGENARATDTEIVIGTYTDLSGVTAMWGVNNTNAWRMVFDEANVEGGINGRKIRYVVEDMQYQVPRAVQAANKLINRDNVFIMVANGGTPINNATMPEQIAKGVPNMFPLTAARSMYYPLNHMKFGFAALDYDMERAGVKLFAEKYGKKAICAMSQDTDFGRDVMDGARDQLKAMNLHLVAETCTSRPIPTSAPRSPSCMTPGAIWCCWAPSCATPCRSSRRSASRLERRCVGQRGDLRPGGGRCSRRDHRGRLHHHVGDLRRTERSAPSGEEFAKRYVKLFGHRPNFAAEVGIGGATGGDGAAKGWPRPHRRQLHRRRWRASRATTTSSVRRR